MTGDLRVEVTGGAGGTVAGLEHLEWAADELTRLAEEVGAVAGQLGMAAARLVELVPLHALVVPDVVAAGRALQATGVVGAALGRAAGPFGAAGEAVALGRLGLQVRATAALYRAVDAAVEGVVAMAQERVASLAGPLLPLLAGTQVGPSWEEENLLDRVDRGTFRMPWLVDAVVGGRDGLIVPPLGRPGPVIDGRLLVEGVTGVAPLVGVLDDAHDVGLVPQAARPGAAAPRTVADLIDAQAALGGHDDERIGARVRVVQVPQPDGSSAWVVAIPGTQEWSPRPGENPFDLTTDVVAMTGRATATATAVRAAVQRAQRHAGRLGRGDPVMLAGHSQGGILAASLASDPRLRAGLNITHVVTSGAPIARFPIPPEVSVLALEHRQDAVPRLDGAANPDRPNWVTVTRDLARDADVGGRASRAHDSGEYAETAAGVDALIARGGHVSVDTWSRGAAPFLAGSAGVVVRDYRLVRGAG